MKLPRRQFLHLASAAALALTFDPSQGQAQEWPARPVTMVVPTAAGGGADILGRILAGRLSEILGQPVIIENVGNAVAATNRIAKGMPDGYHFNLGGELQIAARGANANRSLGLRSGSAMTLRGSAPNAFSGIAKRKLRLALSTGRNPGGSHCGSEREAIARWPGATIILPSAELAWINDNIASAWPWVERIRARGSTGSDCKIRGCRRSPPVRTFRRLADCNCNERNGPY
jgi:Tripartite tricarboxylate transporter family receptor